MLWASQTCQAHEMWRDPLSSSNLQPGYDRRWSWDAERRKIAGFFLIIGLQVHPEKPEKGHHPQEDQENLPDFCPKKVGHERYLPATVGGQSSRIQWFSDSSYWVIWCQRRINKPLGWLGRYHLSITGRLLLFGEYPLIGLTLVTNS